MARTKQKMSLKKKVAAITATTLAAILAIGSAYAWHDFSQSAINRTRGIVSPDVLLHDDFDDEWIKGERNKDVYVENTGNVDTIVRIKFSEYLQIGNDKVVGTNSKNVKTWETHTFKAGATLGDSMKEHNSDAHDYFNWKMTGADKVYLTDTSETGYFDYESKRADFAVPAKVTAHDITKDVLYTIEKGANGQPYSLTLAALVPISMKEYTDNKATYDAEATGRWVLDTDGWCYWSKQLKPGQATNMLLDSIEMIKNPNDNYAYNIYVDLQACNKTEIGDMIAKGGTDDGLALIGSINAYDDFMARVKKVYGTTTPMPTVAGCETEAALVDGKYVLVDEATGDIMVEEVNFTSARLRRLIVEGNTDARYTSPIIDTNGDGKLDQAEIDAVTTISLRTSTIGAPVISEKATDFDLVGLFTNLEILDLSSNDIKSLDLSKNINLLNFCGTNNSLDGIDLSNNVNLYRLELNDSKLTSIDISKLVNLELFQCYVNQLTSLDVSNNPKLSLLHCYENKISSLDVSKATSLVVSNNLRIHTNGMTSLIVNSTQNASGFGTIGTYQLAGNTYGTATVAP